MDTGRPSLALGILCACLYAPAPTGMAADMRKEAAATINQFRSGAPEERTRAFHRLKDDRRAIIDALLTVVREPGAWPDPAFAKYRAIKLLGEYRAVQACEELVRQLHFTPPSVVYSMHPLHFFPAGAALAEIGGPAMRHIVVRLSHPVSDHELKILAYVVYLIDGEEVGLARLESVRAKELQAEVKAKGLRGQREANLARLIEIYKKCEFHKPSDWPRPEQAHAVDKDKVKAEGKGDAPLFRPDCSG